jgi:hypothetical protein
LGSRKIKKMNIKTPIMLLLVATFSQTISGCYTMAVRSPQIARFDLSQRTEIWNRAIFQLQSRNYPITLVDSASGTITTGVVTNGETRQSISLVVSTQGSIICNINREYHNVSVFNPAASGWITSNVEQAVREVEQDQAEFVRSIIQNRI